MDLSIVIPLFNEDESLPELLEWINRVMIDNGYSYEVILIDDGSTDDSWRVIERLAIENKNIKAIK
ncbi:MAG: glycosyltransferase, partial [Ferruginibacter sp.]